jgi:predicted Zn-ribbon and HTH transcriptional regulator
MRNTVVQPCKRCGFHFSIEGFYHKGNVLMHCNDCRSELRQIKRQEMKRLLELEQRLS